MVLLLDLLTIVIPFIIIIVLFRLYYIIFIKGYIKRIEQAEEKGDYDKAAEMKALAFKRQPKRMGRLLSKGVININKTLESK